MSGDALTARVRSLPDGSHEVLAPAVGWWQQAPERGALLMEGERAGLLRVLGQPRDVLLPSGVSGRVATEPPRLRSMPVEYGQVLCRIEPLAVGAGAAAAPAAAADAGGRLLRASQAGRFWRRPDPGAADFIAEGEIAETGRTLGLLEVMKTFQPLKYSAEGGLPGRARLLRWRVADGAEVAEGEALAEFEPA